MKLVYLFLILCVLASSQGFPRDNILENSLATADNEVNDEHVRLARHGRGFGNRRWGGGAGGFPASGGGGYGGAFSSSQSSSSSQSYGGGFGGNGGYGGNRRYGGHGGYGK